MNGALQTFESAGFATRAIHAGQNPEKWKHMAVVPPIVASTTYKQTAPGEHAGFEYSRSGNPTRQCLEESIASLEHAKYGLCFSSGLACTTTIAHLLKSGDHVVSFDDVYGGTNRYFRTCLSQLGVETDFVDARDLKLFEKSLKPNTAMVWMETPTNPTMKIVDIESIAKIIKNKSKAFLVVDNTFMSSYFQKPLLLGADIVMHSVSKYLNGHADVIMGALATSDEDLHSKLQYLQNSLGAVPSPFDSFLVNRGLKTLHVRMERHFENGLAVAQYLEGHPLVEKVLYPGLPSHPQYEIAKKQSSGSSGMVSLYLKANREQTTQFINDLKLFTLAESLGSVESLIEIPALMTHLSLPEEHRKLLGITDNLIRVSVGLEAKEDLIADLKQALEILSKKVGPK